MECQTRVGKDWKAILYMNLSVNAHILPMERWMHSRNTTELDGDVLLLHSFVPAKF